MPRIRTIKPEFFTSQTIDALTLAEQRTFIGLWTYVDDFGKGVDDARLIKAAIWPLREKHTARKVEADMSALESAGLIQRYEFDGRRYFQVLGWAEHQRVNRPSSSRIPPPPPLEGSPRTHGGLTEDSPQERKGKELGNYGREEIHASVIENPVSQNLCNECGDKPWDCTNCAQRKIQVTA